MSKNKNIKSLFNNYIIKVCIALIVMLVYWIITLNISLNKEVKVLKEEFIAKQEESLKTEIEHTLNFINLTKRQVNNRTRNSMKDLVYSAYNIALSTYNRYKDSKSDTEIQNLIIESIKELNSQHENLNISIVSQDGYIILNPDDASMDSLNLLNFSDDKGIFPLSKQIDFAKTNKEGFVQSRWKKPNSESILFYDRTSFLKEFNDLGWIIRCGEFDFNIVNSLKSEILKEVFQLSLIKNNDFFISSYDGIAILINSPNLSNGDNISQMKDNEGFKIFQQELNIINKGTGGYLNYKWKYHDDQYHDVISYVVGIEDLNWIIGIRFNKDLTADELNYMISLLNRNKSKNISQLFSIIILIILLIIILSLNIKKGLLRDFELLKGLVSSAIVKNKNIDFNSLSIFEFKQLAITTNSIFKATKSAKKELIFSEERFKTIIEHAPVMITAFDKKGKYYLWNKECEKILQYNFTEISKHPDPLSLFFTEDTVKFVKSHTEKADGVFRLYKYKLRDNTEVFQKWANFRLNNNDVISVGYDVTELIDKEKLVIEHKTFLQELLNNLPSPVFFKNINLEFEGCNKKYSQIIGKPEISIIGKTVYDLIPQENAEIHQLRDIQLLETEKMQVYEDYIPLSNGKIGIFLVTKSVFYDQNGEKAGIIGVMQDIGKLKAVEKEIIKKQDKLKSLNITKDRLFSIIANDLRDPFTCIVGLSKLLYQKQEKLTKKEINEYLEKLHVSSEQTYRLMDNLLHWSASQINSLEPKPEIIILPNLINESVSLLFERASNKEITILNKIYDNHRVYVDTNMLSSVFRNVISNAIKFTPRKGKILITAAKKSDFIEVRIKDNGIGMDDDTLTALFNIESQLRTQGTDNEKGSGIGLVLSKELININNCSIEVESKPNEGSTFIIALPAVD